MTEESINENEKEPVKDEKPGTDEQTSEDNVDLDTLEEQEKTIEDEDDIREMRTGDDTNEPDPEDDDFAPTIGDVEPESPASADDEN